MNGKWLTELWAHRELLYFFIWRDVKVKYKQSILGIGWAVVQPLFAMTIFTLFFGRLANMPSDGLPYPVFSYTALVPWTYFSAAIVLAGNSLVSNSQMVTKVYFPRLSLPLSSVLSGLVDFAFACLLLFVLMAFYRVPLTGWLLLMPVFLAVAVVLASGIGMFIAALHVRYRDVKYVLPFLMQLWMFVTPIIYPVTMIPERFRPIFALNPLAGVIEGFRSCVNPERGFDLPMIAISAGATLVIFIAGLVYFQKTEQWFADVI